MGRAYGSFGEYTDLINGLKPVATISAEPTALKANAFLQYWTKLRFYSRIAEAKPRIIL